MSNEFFQEALAKVPAHTRIFIKKYTDIVDRIHELMEEKGYLQEDLAGLLGKKESEINKWLSGEHDLSLRTIASLEEALGEEIVVVTERKGQVSPKT